MNKELYAEMDKRAAIKELADYVTKVAMRARGYGLSPKLRQNIRKIVDSAKANGRPTPAIRRDALEAAQNANKGYMAAQAAFENPPIPTSVSGNGSLIRNILNFYKGNTRTLFGAGNSFWDRAKALAKLYAGTVIPANLAFAGTGTRGFAEPEQNIGHRLVGLFNQNAARTMADPWGPMGGMRRAFNLLSPIHA